MLSAECGWYISSLFPQKGKSDIAFIFGVIGYKPHILQNIEINRKGMFINIQFPAYHFITVCILGGIFLAVSLYDTKHFIKTSHINSDKRFVWPLTY